MLQFSEMITHSSNRFIKRFLIFVNTSKNLSDVPNREQIIIKFVGIKITSKFSY